jgi:uncharacterized membrane protein YkgB
MNIKYRLLAISIGVIYLLFGGLKFFPNLSPAETIGIETVQMLTFFQFSSKMAILSLAVFEISIGLLLLCNRCRKIAIGLAICHLILTFTPFLFFPGEVFSLEYNSLSLLGQYILKNIVIIFALVILYPTNVESQNLQTQQNF